MNVEREALCPLTAVLHGLHLTERRLVISAAWDQEGSSSLASTLLSILP
jgi:hypothetical protein